MIDTIQEVVAVFDTLAQLEDAVLDLQTHGFDRAALSVLASEHAVQQKLGRSYRTVQEMEDEPRAPRETFYSRVSRMEAEYGLPAFLAAIGGLAFGVSVVPALIAAGTGAAIGGVLGHMIHRRHAELLREQLERGGLLVWVNVRNQAEADKAIEILQGKSAHDVHLHVLHDTDRS
jgi:hypothetical protein